MFLQNTSSNNPATMNSQEIADLTNTRHDGVKRSIDRLITKGFISKPGRMVIPTTTRPATAYVLDKISAYVAIAQIAPHKITSVIEHFDSIETALADILSALDAFDVPEDIVDMYVYAIREKETGRLKIGISRNPQERLKQLQTGNSSELELVAYKKAENYQDEQLAHEANSQYWIRGEWFSSNASLDKEAV